jgi:TonB family protein
VLLPGWQNAHAAAVRITTQKLTGAATRKVQPRYSTAAKNANAQGQVEVELTIDATGAIQSAQPVSGHQMLREDAKAAAMQWRFDAKKLSDPPADVIGILVFTFKAEDQ